VLREAAIGLALAMAIRVLVFGASSPVTSLVIQSACRSDP
jgi:hypothetical protein